MLMIRVLAAVASIALSVYALADCVQTDARAVRHLPRWAWIVLIVLVPWVGPLTWLVTGHDRSLGLPARGAAARPPRPGPLAPDEDPEFLARLGEQIRRERREREHRGTGADGPAGGHGTAGEPESGDGDAAGGRGQVSPE